jgi:acyl carrier protein
MLDKRLVEAVSRTLGMPAEKVTGDTSHQNTPAWDSVAHLNLILEIEEIFGARFSTEDIPSLTSVGRLQQALEAQQNV